MYKILHLPTGTYLQVKLSMVNNSVPKMQIRDWVFNSFDSCKRVMSWRIVVDNTKDLVFLDENMSHRWLTEVLYEHLEVVEVPDV